MNRILTLACAFLIAGTKTWAQSADADRSAPTDTVMQVQSRPIGDGPTLSGLDVLKRDGFRILKGKRIALLTNISAIDREGSHILDLLLQEPEVKLVTLFSPEHGLYGNLDTKVADFQDTATGLMVRSLYSSKRTTGTLPFKPSPEDLKGLDAVVIDMQDIGARYYTYISYMGKMMEELAVAGVEAIVLDRPNPIGGIYVDGPEQDPDLIGGITSYFPMPIAHGMTMGELAKMFNTENRINCKLTVVPLENWTRDMFFDETGLRWVNPSPNIQDLEAALVYPGIAIPEAILSMGRGTGEPFHVFGSPIIENPEELVKTVMASGLKGARLEVADFVPSGTLARYHHGEGRVCKGARIHITNREEFRAFHLGLAVMDYMYSKYGQKTNASGTPVWPIWRVRGAAASWVLARIVERKPIAETLKAVDAQVARFMPMRAKYLMYPESQKTAQASE